MEYTIEEVLEKVDENMPSLSPTAAKVMQLANNINCPPSELTRVIKLDPVLSMKVMRLVNSSYFSVTSKVVSLEKAIIMLGLNTIKNLALSAALLSQFDKSSERECCLDVNNFWTHSLGVGVTAKMIAVKREIDKKLVEDYFMSGLSHSLGLLIESYFYSDEMEEVTEQVVNMGLLGAEEYALCGLNHCVVGEALAKKWVLPENLVAVMGNYANPEYAGEYQELVLTVYLADIICKNNSIGLVMDKVPLVVAENVWQKLGLDESIEQEIVDNLQTEIKKAMEFLQT